MALTRETLLDYLATRMGVDVAAVDDTTTLFSSNILDSFSMVDLIMFIESEAGVKMDVWDVTLDNLDSIGRILQFAKAKKVG
ncbi:MAG: acyl carrier protein [Bacillota bacterium]